MTSSRPNELRSAAVAILVALASGSPVAAQDDSREAQASALLGYRRTIENATSCPRPTEPDELVAALEDVPDAETCEAWRAGIDQRLTAWAIEALDEWGAAIDPDGTWPECAQLERLMAHPLLLALASRLSATACADLAGAIAGLAAELAATRDATETTPDVTPGESVVTPSSGTATGGAGDSGSDGGPETPGSDGAPDTPSEPPEDPLARAEWYADRIDALEAEATSLTGKTTDCGLSSDASEAARDALAGLTDDDCEARRRAVAARLAEYRRDMTAAVREMTERYDSIVSWGVQEWRLTAAVELVGLSLSRRSDETAGMRNFEPALSGVGSFSLLVMNRPCAWRRVRESGEACPERGRPRTEIVQIASIGFSLLLALPDTQSDRMPRLGLGFAMLFFDDTIGFTVGIDLYRGIDVLDSGRSTIAHTGLVSLMAPEGELTWENGFLGIILNIEGVSRRLTGG